MPTGNAIADGMTQRADMSGERSVQDILSGGFIPSTPITPTLDPKSYVQQSRDILSSGLNNPAIPQLFGRVEKSGKRAADALDIVDEQYRQEELKRMAPALEGLQSEVDDLQSRRARVLPELLSDSKIIDFNAKLRLSSMLQSMFDREIDKTLTKKRDLETGAANRAKLKAETLRAKAQVYDRQAQQDQYMLTQALDLFTAGTGSLQDILQAANAMEENAAKRKAAGKDSNPYIGLPGQDFTSEEVGSFLKADRNFGKLELSDSVGTQYRMRMNARYQEWIDSGRPVKQYTRAAGPATKEGVVPAIMSILSATTDKKKSAEPGYYLNPFPEAANTDIFSRILSGGLPTAGGATSNEE